MFRGIRAKDIDDKTTRDRQTDREIDSCCIALDADHAVDNWICYRYISLTAVGRLINVQKTGPNRRRGARLVVEANIGQ